MGICLQKPPQILYKMLWSTKRNNCENWLGMRDFWLNDSKNEAKCGKQHFKSCTHSQRSRLFLWFTMLRRIQRIKMLHLINGHTFIRCAALQPYQNVLKDSHWISQMVCASSFVFFFSSSEEIANSFFFFLICSTNKSTKKIIIICTFYMSCNSLHCGDSVHHAALNGE